MLAHHHTLTIEPHILRFQQVAHQRRCGEVMFAAQLAVGTVLVAILCYAVLKWEEVGEFVLTYPEAHFFTIAAFILLGRYAGYRMTELWRFRDLVDSTETVR